MHHPIYSDNIDFKNFISKNDLCIMRDEYRIYQFIDDLPIIISLYIILLFYKARTFGICLKI